MNRRFFLLATSAVALSPLCSAVAVENPADVITNFYAFLVRAMQSSGGFRARYTVMEQAIEAAFDYNTMVKIAIGPSWVELPEDKRANVTRVFREYMITSYAARFKSFGGQSFAVTGTAEVPPDKKLVSSKMIRPGDDDIAFNYLLWNKGRDWRVIDIYLGGTISEMARLRAEYSEVMQSRGIDGLLRGIMATTDDLKKAA